MSDRVLDRLAKLLALSKSSNPHEAATASRMAGEIMRKHDLKEADVAEHVSLGFFELSLGSKGFEHLWKFSLATATARYCGCDAVSLLVGGRRKVRLVGDRVDVEEAEALFRSLLDTFKELDKIEAVEISRGDVAPYSTPEEYVDSYHRGMVVAVIEYMMERRPEQFGSQRSSGRSASSTSTEEDRFASPPESKPTSKWRLKFWPWNRSETPPKRIVEEKSLVLIAAPKRKSYKAKVEARYKPRLARSDLHDAADSSAYLRGYDRAGIMVVLPPDSTQFVKRRSKRSS